MVRLEQGLLVGFVPHHEVQGGSALEGDMFCQHNDKVEGTDWLATGDAAAFMKINSKSISGSWFVVLLWHGFFLYK